MITPYQKSISVSIENFDFVFNMSEKETTVGFNMLINVKGVRAKKI
jgi:hypothetical protein